MKKLVLKLIANSLAFWLASLVFHEIRLTGMEGVLIAGSLLTILDFTLRPLLILLTSPLILLSLGVFTLVINAWMIMLTDHLLQQISIPGFLIAFVMGLIVVFIKQALKIMSI